MLLNIPHCTGQAPGTHNDWAPNVKSTQAENPRGESEEVLPGQGWPGQRRTAVSQGADTQTKAQMWETA